MDRDQDSGVSLAALRASRNAAAAEQMVQVADRLITAAQQLLTDSEAELGAAIARRENHEKR